MANKYWRAASKARFLRKMRVCQRKKAYTSKHEAVEYGKLYAQRPYFCQVCNLWHLSTSLVEKVKKKLSK